MKHQSENLGQEKNTPGKRGTITIIVNASVKQVKGRKATFEEVVILAFGEISSDPRVSYTVAYTNGPRQNPEGTMVKGQVVKLKSKMEFDVTPTDQS